MELRLISFIQENPMIYNKSLPDYKDTSLKEQKWRDFSKEMELSVTNLKKRWKTLRDTFYRELRRMESDSKTKKTHWKFFNKLLFLKSLHQESQRSFNMAKFEEDKPYFYESEVETSTQQVFEMQNDEICSNESRLPPVKKKKKYSDYLENEMTLSRPQENTSNVNVLETVPSGFCKTSPIETFFIAMAQQVDQAKLPLEDWCNLQLKLLNNVHAAIKNNKR